jgi:galactokinase
VSLESATAFAPGRVNLIGEHTDYNHGLALPFAIAEGVTVQARSREAAASARIEVRALDAGERDEFSALDIQAASGWRAFPRGVIAELARVGLPVSSACIEIAGDVPQGSGLSSSAALEVALCLALAQLSRLRGEARESAVALDSIETARLCSRVENDWAGAQTGMLDQLSSLCGKPEHALLIDFDTLDVEPVPLRLEGWRLVVLDSGERHTHASSGYNERRAECAAACRELGVDSLRELPADAPARLPAPLDRRVLHVLEENRRVREAVAALRAGDLAALGALLDASHASLRELYEVSTPRVEATVERLRAAGAAGARIVGGGFGGAVLALFAPGVEPPRDAREVRPSAGAHLSAEQ